MSHEDTLNSEPGKGKELNMLDAEQVLNLSRDEMTSLTIDQLKAHEATLDRSMVELLALPRTPVSGFMIAETNKKTMEIKNAMGEKMLEAALNAGQVTKREPVEGGVTDIGNDNIIYNDRPGNRGSNGATQ